MARNPFVIDDQDIAGEWLKQPQLMRAAGLAEADARLERDQAAARLSVARARVLLDVRNHPEDYEIVGKRPIKEVFVATVEIQQEVVNAVEALNQAEYYLSLCKADVTALIDRRKALERRVDLIALNYVSEKDPYPKTRAGRDDLSSRQKHATREGIDDD